MTDLERRLLGLGRELEFPPTPRLAPAVRARLESPGRPAPQLHLVRLRPRRAVALALVGALLLAGTVVAAVPAARDAVLDLLGLRGATIERTTTLPEVPPPSEPRLGSPVSLRGARSQLDFDPLVPAGLGRPEEAFVRRLVPGGELSLTYPPRPGLPRTRLTGVGLLVSEFRGDLDPSYVGKIVTAANRVERLRIGGDRAVWVAGAPHLFFYRDPDDAFRKRGLRLAANVLLLERGRLLVRLEGEFSQRAALALARSLR